MKEVYVFLDSILNDDDVIVFGCSGGPDSMCLMDILLKYKSKKNISIVCAVVNHKLRKESDDEVAYLKDFCKKNKIIFEDMVINSYGDDNFHNEARNIRYNFFEGLVKKYNAKFLMTAHHGDDLIETILMRIVRGSTVSGYSGFNKIVDKGGYSVVRPLITVTKDQIMEYNKENKITYFIDKSNFSSKYTRNRYRKEVLPFLKEEDKSVHLKFLKYSNMLNKYDEYINNEALKKLKTLISEDKYINIEDFK